MIMYKKYLYDKILLLKTRISKMNSKERKKNVRHKTLPKIIRKEEGAKMKSMTGYGKVRYSDDDFEIDIEVKSVNGRFLDSRIKLSHELSFLEIDLKTLLKRRIKRGKVEININFQNKIIPELYLDEENLKAYWKIYNQAKKVLKAKSEIPLEQILSGYNVISIKTENLEKEKFKNLVLKIFEEALSEHQKMAMHEGKSMLHFFNSAIKKMSSSLSKIEKEFPKYKKEISEKLNNTLTTLLKQKLENDDYKRILLESAIYIEKADVTEEIVRIKHHLDKFEEKINQKNTEIGKSINFILQEMQREINTIGSKFNFTSVFDEIISIKEEIEKCREIVQNVE